MRKALIISITVFLIITLLIVGLYFVYKNSTKNNLDNKLKTVNNNWTELLKTQDKNNNLLRILITGSPQNIQYSDSLNIYLIEYNANRKDIGERNPDFVYKQYLANKYMLPLIKFYSENHQLANVEKKNILKNTLDNIEKTNKIIKKYNSSVRDYNLYYSSFPNFVIAKSYGFKRKDYFEMQFGVDNKDPKIAKKERREWQRKIEMEHGLSE
ncbi:LemA family protein [Flavobacterium sp. WV_118_3]|uniref:LemA family protein n=1 Tax=Flavobacterium sp. WV_118_3 TaxID=3151764 RepID=UPI0032192914